MPKAFSPLILIPIVFGAIFVGCGSMDYDQDQTLPSEVTTSWREEALKARVQPSTVSLGNFPKGLPLPELSAIPNAQKCPEETLCFSSLYFGEEQLSHFLKAYPNLISLNGAEGQRTYAFHKIPSILIEADLLILDEGSTLSLCGTNLKIITSELNGSGIINTSGCNKEIPHGGSISVVASKVEGIKFLSNGMDGSNGKDGVVSWQPAKNGDPRGFRIDVDYQMEPTKICVDGFSCLLEAAKQVSKSGTDEQIREAIRERADDLARLNLEFLQRMGAPRGEIERITVEAASSLKDLGDLMTVYLGGGGCFFSSDPRKQNGETGFAVAMNPRVSGLDLLNGEDAKFRSDGGDGESGGNAGKIEIVAKELKIATPMAKPGPMGKSGKSYVQEPGKGATPLETSREISYRVFARVSCEIDPGGPGNKQYFLRNLDFEVRKSFRIGEAYGLNRTATLGPRLAESMLNTSGVIQGRDGKALTIKAARSGTDGKPEEPSIIKASINELIEQKVRETCPSCTIPKALQTH